MLGVLRRAWLAGPCPSMLSAKRGDRLIAVNNGDFVARVK
jgi:hypothetical protein